MSPVLRRRAILPAVLAVALVGAMLLAVTRARPADASTTDAAFNAGTGC